jgi:hypothetical protein
MDTIKVKTTMTEMTNTLSSKCGTLTATAVGGRAKSTIPAKRKIVNVCRIQKLKLGYATITRVRFIIIRLTPC